MLKLLRKLYSSIKIKLGSVNVTRISNGTQGGKVYFYPGTEVANSSFEGNNYIHNAFIHNSQLGSFTYIGPKTRISNSKIGRFCSIASEVSIGLGTHPSRDYISMHPSFYSTKNTGIPVSFVTKQKLIEGANITIGNDVWIGHRAIILDGVTIGDGAAIGAASLVTKDVPPYAIVGGVPAKIIRYRFSDDQIAKLLQIKWWNKSEKWIRENAENFDSFERFEQTLLK